MNNVLITDQNHDLMRTFKRNWNYHRQFWFKNLTRDEKSFVIIFLLLAFVSQTLEKFNFNISLKVKLFIMPWATYASHLFHCYDVVNNSITLYIKSYVRVSCYIKYGRIVNVPCTLYNAHLIPIQNFARWCMDECFVNVLFQITCKYKTILCFYQKERIGT